MASLLSLFTLMSGYVKRFIFLSSERLVQLFCRVNEGLQCDPGELGWLDFSARLQALLFIRIKVAGSNLFPGRGKRSRDYQGHDQNRQSL